MTTRQFGTRELVRMATVFYGIVALASWGWAAAWGVPLFGEGDTSTGDLLEGLWTGLGIVAFCHIASMLFRSVRRASDRMAELLGPITVVQAVYLAGLSGFAEELCFRGALWTQLGWIGTSVFFGLCHVVPMRGLAWYPLFAFFAGIILGGLRQHTGSVWSPTVAHMTVNALNLAWLGRRVARTPRVEDESIAAAPQSDMHFPAELDVPDTFPITVWRYDLRVELTGTDRQTLPQCLEHEDLAIFRYVPRERVYEELAGGMFVFTQAFEGPLRQFPSDVSTIASYLFETVIGIEVAERFVNETTTDDVRAWKIVAQRGEWVKVALVIDQPERNRFIVDPEREDEQVLTAQWATYPRWFQDGMRFKYPRLRNL